LTVEKADRDRRTVDARLIETFEDCFVELRVRSASEETVKFYEEEEVDVFGGRGLAVALADVMAFRKVDTLLL